MYILKRDDINFSCLELYTLAFIINFLLDLELN